MRRHEHRPARSCVTAALPIALFSACGGPIVVPLRSAAGPRPVPSSHDAGLEVVTQSNEASDPLPVSGTGVSYGDFEATLRQAITAAAAPWAAESWRISLDIVAAEAEHTKKRLHVSIGVRATLRAKQGNIYLGQTEVACRDSATVSAEKGQHVFRSCISQLAGALSVWLGSVDNDSPQTTEPDDPKVLSGAVGASGSAPVDGDGNGDGDGSGSSEAAGGADGPD